MATNRIYRVGDKLIRANTQASAIRAYAQHIEPIRVANSDDLIELTKAGVEVIEPAQDQQGDLLGGEENAQE